MNQSGHHQTDPEFWIQEWLTQIKRVSESRWPKKFRPVIKGTPRVGDLYWCNFHRETEVELPEMWKTRPCVIVSRKNVLHGKVTVLPFSTSLRNADDGMAHEVSKATRDKLDGRVSWILCDHPCTVATSRLRQVKGGVPKLPSAELRDVLLLMTRALAEPLP
ncbi:MULTISPECIES: type II toxin-antitoxin system PemK/MazF family toxin [Pannonibacter]|uniref:type II toxin-antitoxin system PemK/MazF family toxin n=1 Tax=Pannonibacter TaxID=227873 RepID=UPI0009E2D933|nr:type II toxin-antitoxin system PemK/MazF family toxin [Pannonibacter phragmitetus]MBA4206907.1 type II toxin-antitoxin system PemK/MazF family toxin [Polymorphum sp.]